MLRKSLLCAAVALLVPLTLGAATASAVLVEEWDYHTTAAFSAFAPSGPAPQPSGSDANAVDFFVLNGGTIANPTFGLPTTLSWGTPVPPGGQSFFSVTGSVDSISTGIPLETAFNGDPGNSVLDLRLTHGNFAIEDFGQALTSATLLGAILLEPLVPPGDPLQPPTQASFSISFFETLNEEPCVSGADPPCRDLFVLNNPETLSFTFTLDDFNYTVSVSVTGVDPLSDAECNAVGAASGCFGFSTIEGQENILEARLTIEATPVPAPVPSTLVLLGLGLALAGLRSMRSRKLR